MTAGAIIIPDKAKLNMLNAVDLLNPANTFNITLHTNAFVPNDSTNELFSDLTNELATGNGYTAGGLTLTGVAISQTAGVVKFTSSPGTWNASVGNIPAWRYAYIHVVGTLGGKVNPLVGHFLGDATPADVPATIAGNPLTITPSPSGLISAT